MYSHKPTPYTNYCNTILILKDNEVENELVDSDFDFEGKKMETKRKLLKFKV